MKIYLAGPMRGYRDSNFPAFHEAAASLRSQGHYVFNPAEQDGDNIRELMKTDLSWICDHAEAIAILPGWQTSTGVKAELALATAIGITHLMFFPDTDNFARGEGSK